MASADVNGITVGYDDTGQGRPLVLIHGHPFDRSMWAPQVPGLAAAGWRVITPDLRGYGQTTVVPGITPLAEFARDIAGLLDHLGVADFVLGGLSMGGQIVMECWRLFADRITALVLADTFPGLDTEDGRKARLALAERLTHEGMARYADEVLPSMMTPANIAAQPAVAAHVLAMMAGTNPDGAAAALRGRAARRDYTALLPSMTVPTLIVVGRQDEFTPVADALSWSTRLPRADVVIIEDAGHLPNLERPVEFNEKLGAFLGALA